jgi:parallel beta-helix repeat protein
VSASGNDSNSGISPDQPWKSLAKVNSFIPVPGDQILFNRGDEWVGTIKANASGTSGSPVIYGAYGTGSMPKIYGSQEITGWEVHSGNIYKAKFDAKVGQLFINDKRATLARYPNSGYFTITNALSSTQFTSTELNGGINYTGASWVGRTSAYTMFSKTITSSSSQTLTISSTPFDGSLQAGKGFFLCDKKEFIDKPGEWYYDAAEKMLYLWAPNGDSPANYSVRGATFDYGVAISGKNYVTVKDLEILHSSVDGILIANSSYITAQNNRIISPDLVGVHVPSGNSNATVITGNYIYQANGGGIRCYSHSATISDNILEDTGLLENINKSTYASSDNFGTAIFSRGDNPDIRYNRIINSGYCGINWKGQNGDISCNYVNGACQVLDDGGGIYTYNGYDYKQVASAGSVVKNNIVLNVFGNREGYTNTYDGGFGIYMDNNSHDILIEGNTVAYTSSAIYLHQNGKIKINNNTLMDAILLIRSGQEVEDNTITNNTFYLTGRSGDFVWWKNTYQRMIYEESATSLLDQNKYVSRYNSNVFRHSGKDRIFSDWKSLTKQDINSTINNEPMAEGETEHLFYNDTKKIKTIDLGNATYKDVLGNPVSGKFTLEPFTSKILIGTNFDNVETGNQPPVIPDQFFDITSPKTAGELIGQVEANDPDVGQNLTYAIVQGNEAGLFSLDFSTGELRAKADITATPVETVILVVEVTDNAENPLSANANVTINLNIIEAGGENQIPDMAAPVISSFSIPPTAESLTVAVIDFTASDDVAVAGYCLTQTSTTPAANDPYWLSTAPDSYTFELCGDQTLYAWTKDASGNISTPSQASTIITLPDSADIVTSVEHVAICEGESYLGWTEGGVYQRTVPGDTIQTGSNLIENSDFSTGANTWKTWGATGYNIDLVTNSQDFISSPASLQANCTANGDNVSSLHLITGGNIALEAGKEYEFSFYAKGSVDFTVGKLYLNKATYPWTKFGSFEILSPVITKSWDQYKIKFTATHTANDAQLRIYLGNSLPAGQSLFLDDVVFAEIIPGGNAENQIITTYLTVNPVQYATEEVTIMEGENYLGWTEAGQYQRTLTAITGCDSIVTTNLQVTAAAVHTVEDITIYEGENYLGWTEPGQYERVLTSSAGGDSIVTTNLFVTVETPTSVEYITICEGESYLGWTEAGEYQHTIPGDTIQTGSNLIENSDFSTGTNTWETWGATGYNIDLVTNSQDFISSPASLQANCTANGVEVSSLHLITGENIALEAGKEYELSFYAKGSVDFTVGKLYLNKATYPWTKFGSFEILSPAITKSWDQYKIKFTSTHTANDAQLRIYLGNSLPAGQSLFLDDVVFAEMIPGGNAENQIITTYLTVNPVQYATEEVTIKEGENYLGWTEAGQYQRTLTAITGCDSIVTTNLQVTAAVVYSVEDVTICEGDNYLGWTEPGQYERTLTSSTGGDSIVTTVLSVNPIQYTTEEVTIVKGEDYMGWKKEGYYERTLTSATGCDSIVTTVLTIENKTANNNSSTKSENVTTSSSETEYVANEFILYPNPAKSSINIEYSYLPEMDTTIEILNGNGQTVYSERVESVAIRIDIDHLISGMYFIRSVSDNQSTVKKLIVR